MTLEIAVEKSKKLKRLLICVNNGTKVAALKSANLSKIDNLHLEGN